MKEIALEAKSRSVGSRHSLNKLRVEGKIPGNFYGHGEKNISVEVDSKAFTDLINKNGMNVLIKLKLGDGDKTAIIKEIQRDMITQHPLHIDFQAISLKEKITVHVPIHIEGIAPGVKLSSGIMENLMRDVLVKCLPTNIPKQITVDVSKLEIGDAIAVKDLPAIEGIEVISAPESIIINIVAPAKEEEKPAEEAVAAATGAPAAASAEPEVISKGKKDKEEGAAPAAGEKAAPAGGAAPAKK